MIHLRLEIHLRRFERVIRREVNRDEEQSALVRRVARSDDRRVPVENIIVRPRARAAGRRRVLLQICSRRACASSVIRARANALSYRSKREDVGQPETRRRRRRRAARAVPARARPPPPGGGRRPPPRAAPPPAARRGGPRGPRAEPRDAGYCVASFRARARLGTASRASQAASASDRVGRAIPRRSSRRARASRDDASRARARRANAPKSSLMILFDAMSIGGALAARDVELCGGRSSDEGGAPRAWNVGTSRRGRERRARRRRRRGRVRVRDSTRERR